MKKPEENLGHSTEEALGILHEEVANVLNDFLSKIPSRWDCMLNVLTAKNELSRFSFISIVYILLISFSLFFASFFTDIVLYGNLAGQGIFIFSICILNIFLVSWDNQLRINEVPEKVKNLLQLIQECQKDCHWAFNNYPNMATPFSPCITLQWTYRDRRLLNLPWALLVRGDVIVLKPGQASPGYVIQEDNQAFFLTSGEVYSPPQKHEAITAPTARVPLQNKRFILTETPLLKNVKEVLEASLERNSVTSFDKQVHLVTIKFLQNVAVPVFISCTLLLGLLRTVYVEKWVGSPHWSITYLLIPSCVVIPIVPIVFPVAWIALNMVGNAKLAAYLNFVTPHKGPVSEDKKEEKVDDEIIIEELNANLKWREQFSNVLLGRQQLLTLIRSCNPLHVLGSVTALCCVDKKGILSWPNPTAEKVFFLKTGDRSNITRDTTINDDASDSGQEDVFEGGEGDSIHVDHPTELCTRVEVLDLTHDSSSPFKLQFDDTHWSAHLGSLKPIGLSVLLNTCNMKTQEHYVKFCSHVTCEALYNEDLVPVTNRRCPYYRIVFSDDENVHLYQKCLCELANIIGFRENARNNYHLHEQLCTFRHVQPEAIRRDIKFARSLALASKLKLPFPHMVAVVISEASVNNSYQLFSQATGDIALDSCVDYWDGSTVRALSQSDKKKIADFNQRFSASAYCSVMIYRPLPGPISSELSKVYMELPADSSALYMRNKSPVPPDQLSATERPSNGNITETVSDIDGCFEMQCNQIFLGMITMQYQAKSDMVHLIEQLEKACIRFVHFSKENELRSRVFSEKMGLESGWNCHISLLSSSHPEEEADGEAEVGADADGKEKEWGDENTDPRAPLLGANLCSLEGSRAMSVSAPCAINTQMARDETDGSKAIEDEFEIISQEGWQSLSCLSDSTEQSAPINFDMSNRAKLPRGIDQIRPHLEKVDNVPLLVSLFTDCTPRTTEQMIEIMQDYGEIVCVVGSDANADNSSIFLKADASLSIEPMYPQVCQKVQVIQEKRCRVILPTMLSASLNALPCSISITAEKPISIFALITLARHFMLSLWNCIQFWICSVVALCFMQLITLLVMLPPLLNAGEVLWLSLVVIPLLSVSLIHCPTSAQVMQKPVDKKQSAVNTEVALFVSWCYGFKFLPTLLFIPLIYGLTLASFCVDIALSTNSSCTMAYPLPNSPMGGWELHFYPFTTAQLLATSVLVLHFVIVSVSFVHREYLSWRRNPFKNKCWFFTALLLVGLQVMYFLTSTLFLARGNSDYRLNVPWVAIFLAVFSLALIYLVNELIKWQEIKANLRYEKRVRLDFGTKLGMNSPF